MLSEISSVFASCDQIFEELKRSLKVQRLHLTHNSHSENWNRFHKTKEEKTKSLQMKKIRKWKTGFSQIDPEGCMPQHMYLAKS